MKDSEIIHKESMDFARLSNQVLGQKAWFYIARSLVIAVREVAEQIAKTREFHQEIMGGRAVPFPDK
jgi:hypothetical protein